MEAKSFGLQLLLTQMGTLQPSIGKWERGHPSSFSFAIWGDPIAGRTPMIGVTMMSSKN